VYTLQNYFVRGDVIVIKQKKVMISLVVMIQD